MNAKQRLEKLEKRHSEPVEIFVTLSKTPEEIEAARQRAKVDPDFIFISVTYGDKEHEQLTTN
jgi:hypothetical protein